MDILLDQTTGQIHHFPMLGKNITSLLAGLFIFAGALHAGEQLQKDLITARQELHANLLEIVKQCKAGYDAGQGTWEACIKAEYDLLVFQREQAATFEERMKCQKELVDWCEINYSLAKMKFENGRLTLTEVLKYKSEFLREKIKMIEMAGLDKPLS